MNRIRNPFGRKPPVANGVTSEQDENQRPPLASDQASLRSSFAGSRASSSLSIKPKSEEPNEYKLSEIWAVVNDSGVYLPPSPPEKKSFWAKSPQLNRGNSNHRSMLNENEPFSISRESFDSYRRSFDISARSPVPQQGEWGTPRQSLDARKSLDSRQSLDRAANVKLPRSAIKDQIERERPTSTDEEVEERFEDVGLNDPEAAKQQPQQKKKGMFSRFVPGDSSEPTVGSGDAARPSSSHRSFHIPGRKRGQSGQGAELGSIEQSGIKGEDDGVVR